jgi:RNA polymerase sigma-70 factor (ECF subfamily)
MNLSLNPSCTNAILRRVHAETQPADDADADALLSALIARIAAGDEAALARFYELTLARAYGLALKITGRRDMAEDVCAETYWQCWREAARFDAARGQPLAWLMMMTRSRALDALRRLGPLTYCEDPEIHRADGDCQRITPCDQLVLDERAGALARALQTLTPIQRQLVALAFYRDLSHQEISDQTGLPLGTVKSHLKRAQDSLRSVLPPP